MSSSQCFLCKSKELEWYRQSNKILRCSSCQIIFLAPEMVPASLDEYYQNNDFYAENASNPVLVKSMLRAADFYLKTIVKHLNCVEGQLLVDVGSNYGVLVEEAKHLGFEALGLEKNNFLVEVCRQRGLNVFSSNLVDLELAKEIDVITAMHVLEHLTDPRSFIEEAYHKLTPGGLLVIGVPNINSYLAKKDALSWRYIALEHLFYFSPGTLTQLLNQAGFEIIESRPDGTNLDDLSLKKLLHYLIGPALTRDRFQAKTWTGRATDLPAPLSWWRKILKSILILIIRGLKREDFIVIVSRKTSTYV